MKNNKKSKLFRLLGLLIPIFTFLLGYTFNQVDEFMKEVRKEANLKTMINLELRHNYQILNRAGTSLSDQDVPTYYYDAMSLMLKRLSMDVYSNYLDRINILSPEEVKKIYDAYYFTNLCKTQTDQVINAFSEIKNSFTAPSNAQRTKIASEVTILVGLSETSFEKITDALRLFPNADDWIRAMSAEKGADLRKYKETLKLLEKQKNE